MSNRTLLLPQVMMSKHKGKLKALILTKEGHSLSSSFLHPASDMEGMLLHSCWLSNARTLKRVISQTVNKAIVDNTSTPVCHLLPVPLYMITNPNNVALPGEYVGNFDYLLQHGGQVVTANATRHMAKKPEVDNVLHYRQRRTEPRPWLTRKFQHVVFEICEQTVQRGTFDRNSL